MRMATPTPTPLELKRKTCPVAKFGRPHFWVTGAFYWPHESARPARQILYVGEEFVMCAKCGQTERMETI